MTRDATPCHARLDQLQLIHVDGADAGDFLQAQLSNDLFALGAGRAQLSAWCSPKGRVLALFRITQLEHGFSLLLPAALRAAILRRLQLYVLRAKVLLRARDDLKVVGLHGAAALAAADAAGLTPAQQTGERGYLLCTDEQLDGLDQALAGSARVDEREWQVRRLAAGEPQVHPATQDRFVPQMLNLDRLDGLSFNKGCYPGQEIVARTRYLGAVKRRFALYRAPSAVAAAAPGTALVTTDGAAAGELVELIETGDGALAGAVIRLAHAGQPVQLGDAGGATLQPLPLPYSLEEPA